MQAEDHGTLWWFGLIVLVAVLWWLGKPLLVWFLQAVLEQIQAA